MMGHSNVMIMFVYSFFRRKITLIRNVTKIIQKKV